MRSSSTRNELSVSKGGRSPRPRLLGSATAVALLLSAGFARGDVCFPTPVALPGLSGPPDWTAPGTIRAELNEPRWAAAPQTGFESDPTDAEGLYRVIYDAGSNQLSVSFQAPTDPDVPSNADAIYFGFTTDGTTATLAQGVRISLPSAATDPVPATNLQQYNYNAGTWTTPLGSPTWLVEPAGWLSDATAAWGINFKVDLATAGLNPANPFKIIFAMHKRDEAAAPAGVNVWTPDPGANPLFPGSLFIQNPDQWADAVAVNAGCVDGIVLQGNQIGTRNIDMGNPAPTKINTTNGATNRFYAQPTIPGTIPLFAGLFQGRFHVANWGSIAASNAPWVTIPNGDAVQNGVAPAADNATLEFDCPVNAGGQTCGLPTPAEDHQCVYVELRAAPGQTVPFTKAAAYRNMDFKALSDFSAPAEISVKGLKAVLGNDNPRDVYLYVHAKNMPAHSEKPLWLPTDRMAATRRFAESPPPPVRREQAQRPNVAAARPRAVAPVRDPKVLRKIPTPNTGIRDLDLNAHQALSTVWPTVDVHVYYDTGKTILIDKTPTKHLAPMYPFTYFYSHEGPLFGFSQALKGIQGAEVKELRPNVYMLRIASEGVAKIATSAVAHEKPRSKKPDIKEPPPIECPQCPKVQPTTRCYCRVPGGGTSGSSTPWVLAIGAVLAWALRRKWRTRGTRS